MYDFGDVWVNQGVGDEKAFLKEFKCNRVYCIHVLGHDPITFSFRSFSFLIGWGFYSPII